MTVRNLPYEAVVALTQLDLDHAEVLAAGGWPGAPRAELAVYRMERIEEDR